MHASLVLAIWHIVGKTATQLSLPTAAASSTAAAGEK
jgi:hypothetical protein